MPSPPARPDVDWELFIERIAAGETIKVLCNGRNGMPTGWRYARLKAEGGPLVARIREASRGNMKAQFAVFARKGRRTRIAQGESHYREAVQRVDWARFLARLEGGERSVDLFKAGSGMPTERECEVHRRENAAFAAELNRIRALKASRLALKGVPASRAARRANATARWAALFASVDWSSILDRIRAGEAAYLICDGEEGRPTLRQLRAYRDAHPDFDRQVREASQGRRGARLDPDRARAFLEVMVARGRQAAEVETGTHSHTVKRLTTFVPSLRGEYQAALDRRAADREAQRDKSAIVAVERLRTGVSIQAAFEGLDVSPWLIRDGGRTPAQAAVHAILAERGRRRREARMRIVRPEHFYREAANRHLMAEDNFAKVTRAVARTDIAFRDEVRSAMLADIFDGLLHPDDAAAAVGHYLREARGEADQRRHTSLEASRFEGGRTFGETYVDWSSADAGDLAGLSAGWA